MTPTTRTWYAFACVAVLASATQRTANAQQIRPYRPAFDVADYTIALDLPDTGATIHANATLTVARTGKSDTLVLDLLDLAVNSVTVDGRVAKWVRNRETVDIALPHKSGARPTYKVSVDYGGAVTDGLITRSDSAGRWTYFGDNWPNRARHWIPSIDHPSDKATVTWRVTTDPNRTVVANGRLISTRAVNVEGVARQETVWQETRPIPVYLMVVAAAPLVEYDLGDTACGLAELQRCVPQMVYTAPEQRTMLPGPFGRASGIVQLFSRLVGPFPYEKLAHLQSSTRFGGMENASNIFYADDGFRRHTMMDGVIAHETAHQWFGDAVTEREWPHIWLSEGFATFFATLWTRAARGDSAFRVEMAGIRRTVLDDSASVPRRPVIDTIETNYLALLNRNSYEKGGFVLHMLRAQVGERAFFDAIRAYYAKHKHSTALTDDLRAEMERESKQDLRWFFDQWLRRPGYPEVTADWSYDAAAHEVVVDVTQGQRFGAFEFPLTVAAIDSERRRPSRNNAHGGEGRRWTTASHRDVREAGVPDTGSRRGAAREPDGDSAMSLRGWRVVAVVAVVATLSTPRTTRAQSIHTADSLLDIGALARAESTYYLAARARPRDPLARWALGRFLVARGAPRVGATLFEEALQFGGEPSLIVADLAPVYLELGMYHELAALPAPSLSGAERERARWLDAHPTRLISLDSLVKVAYKPSLASGDVGRLNIRVNGQLVEALINPRGARRRRIRHERDRAESPSLCSDGQPGRFTWFVQPSGCRLDQHR